MRAAASWPTYVHPRRIKGGEQFQGAGIAQAATFVFSVKEPLFTLLRDEIKDDARKLAEEMWTATTLLDKLGLYKSLSAFVPLTTAAAVEPSCSLTTSRP